MNYRHNIWEKNLFYIFNLFEATQMNMQYSLIQELMFHEFELGHDTAKTTKKKFVMQKKKVKLISV